MNKEKIDNPANKKLLKLYEMWARKEVDTVAKDCLIPESMTEDIMFGVTPMHILANVGELEKIPDNLLTTKNLQLCDRAGQSVAGSAAEGGFFHTIPKKFLNHSLLTSPKHFPIAHTLAKKNEFSKIPKNLITKELLLARDRDGETVAHALAIHTSLEDLPTEFHTKDILLVKDNKSLTPIDYLSKKGKFDKIPESFLTNNILFPNKGREHCILDSIIQGCITSDNYSFYKRVLKLLSQDNLLRLKKSQGSTPVLIYTTEELAKRKAKQLFNEESLAI
jgi:hypothetical protein